MNASTGTETDIYIIGTGIRAADDFTRESIDVLGRCQEVFFVDPAIGTRALLASHCAKVTSLYEESYRQAGHRLPGYRHMAIRVVEAALDRAPVCFAMHGHPMVLCEAPFLIHKMASALGLRAITLPGVSALDHLFVDLSLDPGTNGVLMYEATDLLLHRRPLVPEVPTLLWQVGNVETRLHTSGVSRPERFHRLLEYLQATYPADHKVTTYYASPHALLSSRLNTFPLRDLPHDRRLPSWAHRRRRRRSRGRDGGARLRDLPRAARGRSGSRAAAHP